MAGIAQDANSLAAVDGADGYTNGFTVEYSKGSDVWVAGNASLVRNIHYELLAKRIGLDRSVSQLYWKRNFFGVGWAEIQPTK